MANYGYTDTRIYDPLDPTLDGNRQRNVPYNAANLWSRYDFIDDGDRTFGAALGMVYLDERPGDLTNTFVLDSFVRWDAGLYYRQGAMVATLYAENVFDLNYSAASVDAFQVYPGARANLRGQIGFVW